MSNYGLLIQFLGIFGVICSIGILVLYFAWRHPSGVQRVVDRRRINLEIAQERRDGERRKHVRVTASLGWS